MQKTKNAKFPNIIKVCFFDNFICINEIFWHEKEGETTTKKHPRDENQTTIESKKFKSEESKQPKSPKPEEKKEDEILEAIRTLFIDVPEKESQKDLEAQSDQLLEEIQSETNQAKRTQLLEDHLKIQLRLRKIKGNGEFKSRKPTYSDEINRF